MKKRRFGRCCLGGALVRLKRAVSKRNRYFPSKGTPTACPTMARNSPTVVVARYFLKSFAHFFLRQRPDNFCRSLRGAAAESNATSAVQGGGSTAGPGSSEELCLREHGSWLVPSEHGLSCSATPALEHIPLRTPCEFPAAYDIMGLLTAGAVALEHRSSRIRLLTARALAAYSLVLMMATIKSGLRGCWATSTM